MFTWLATSSVKHFFLNLKQQLLLNVQGSLFTVNVKRKKGINNTLKQGLPCSSNQHLANFVVLRKEKCLSLFD